MPAFDSFVILAEMRTGSNLLQSYLNAAPGVTCRGELFNPAFVENRKTETLLGYDLARRDSDPLGLLAAVRGQDGLNGFRLFQDHDARVRAQVLADPACAKIVLTRNPLDMYVSHKQALATDQWMLLNVLRQRSARVRFDAAEFAAYLDRLQTTQRETLHQLQTGGQTAFFVHYDDLGDLAVINGLLAWLGVPGRLAELPRDLKKQNPGPIEDRLENPQDLAPGLARIDRFDLGRTPNFEPRRAPMLGLCAAPPRAPVLFLPLRGAPEGELFPWLAALDGAAPEALLRDFDAARLRDWRRTRPGRLSFSVLRHPWKRAHLAFRRRVLGGDLRPAREHLERLYGVAPDDPALRRDPAAHRDAFLAWLRFCRASLSGQTGLQPWPVWASQAALVEGWANGPTGSPDLLLREDRLASGLRHLCAELGLDCPPLPAPEAHDDPIALADILDDEVVAACRAAYRRDFDQFGFPVHPD